MPYLKYEKEGNVGIVTLDNPQKLNMVGEKFLDELEQIQKGIYADKSLRGMAIVANGSNFSAGIDITYLQTVGSRFIKDSLEWLQGLYSFWQKLPYPVVAGVQGYCIGSGIELILGCDIRVAGESAKFSLPEVRFGLAPDMGGTSRLTKLVGVGQAKRLILLCEEIEASEALRIGLVEKVVPDERLTESVMKMVRTMSTFPPSGLRFAKKTINVAQDSSLAASLLMEEAQSTYCCGTQDLLEATTAYIEKRKPAFRDE